MSRQVDIKALVSHIVKGDGKDRCRICMGDTTEGQVFLGDTVMMDGDKPVTLAELLEVITGVEVTQDRDLPDCLCSLCYMAAYSFAEFRNLCHQSSNKWNSILDLLSHIPDSQYSINTHKMTATLCNDTITIQQEIIKDKGRERKERKLNKHVKKEVRVENAKSIKCECPNCGKKFLYAQHLAKHLKESTDYQRACHLCAKIMSRDDLVQHLIQIHKKRPYDCKKCLAIFRSTKQYTDHLSKAHTKGSCTCGDCGRSFRSSAGFHAHMSIHVQKKCPSCYKLFRNQTCYMYHVKHCCNLDKNRKDTHILKHKVTVLVDGPKKAVKVGLRGSAYSECVCDYCHKKFAGKKFIAAHIQIVHLKNTHRPCSYCGKMLAAAHMPTHLKKHEQVSVYMCDQCGMSLKSKLGYQQHLRLHSGEKPYLCQHCSEAFTSSSRRSEHIRKVHNNEAVLNYACENCPAKFRIPYKLKKHMETVHSKELKYSCSLCNLKFPSCRALFMHCKHNHKN